MAAGPDIAYFYSGGSSNFDEASSLGGPISTVEIINGQDAIFGEVAKAFASIGLEDYRCIYAVNKSSTGTLNSANVFINYLTNNANIAIGSFVQDETQQIAISGTATGGTVTLGYGVSTGSVSFDPNNETWEINFQTAISTLIPDATVRVAFAGGDNATYFTVTISSKAGSKSYDLISIVNNSLTGGATVETYKLQNGGPINSMATTISDAKTPPPGVNFIDSSATNPIVVGDLEPLDNFYIWLRRIVPPNSALQTGQGFRLSITGSSTAPVVTCSLADSISWSTTGTPSCQEFLSGGIQGTTGGFSYTAISPNFSLDLTNLNDSNSIVFDADSDDFTFMINVSDTIVEGFSSTSSPAQFNIPDNYVLFRDTMGHVIAKVGSSSGSVEKTFINSSSSYTFQAGGPETGGTGHVQDMEAGGFATRDWSDGITKAELRNRGFMTGDTLNFKFAHIVGGRGFTQVRSVSCF